MDAAPASPRPNSRTGHAGASPWTIPTCESCTTGCRSVPRSSSWHESSGATMSKRIDQHAVAAVTGSRYPPPFDAPCAARVRRRLGDAAGLSDFGVNLLRLAPGAWSSQRHWHTAEDEFVFVLDGEVILVTDTGEEILRTGDGVGFKGGTQDGHHLQNRSQHDAVLLEVGSRT